MWLGAGDVDGGIFMPADSVHGRLERIHGELLTLHKTLLDAERIRYEARFEAIRSPGHFLQLLINDPFFAWLRKLSGLITQIDEFLSAKELPEVKEGEALIEECRSLLSPDEGGTEFQREYQRAIQESP